jgi:hypothetical protein
MDARKVYMVLSPRSLSYAAYALESLFHNSIETLDLRIITDSLSDKAELTAVVTAIEDAGKHRWSVYAEDDLLEREESVFGARKHLRAFRHGHPCWRKVTDPLLLAAPGEEIVLLDPDLYFPNRFTFEQTLPTGLLVMWQRPNCLLPHETVDAAIRNHIPLAHHVDIGVANWRSGTDLDWLDWLLGTLADGKSLPRYPHVEAIVWSAIAMREGGGHLDPKYWRCWHRTQVNRVKVKLGAGGVSVLKPEHWSEFKCFHAAGESKYWLAEAKQAGLMESGSEQTAPGTVIPFVELTPKEYGREQAVKGTLRKMGYYKLFGSA